MLFLEKKSQAFFQSGVCARSLSFSSLEVIFLGRFADDPEVVDPDSPAPEIGPCFLFRCPKDPSVGGGVAIQDRVFPHYVPNSSIKHSKSDSKDRSQEIL
jgi:hypothetical protein